MKHIFLCKYAFFYEKKNAAKGSTFLSARVFLPWFAKKHMFLFGKKRKIWKVQYKAHFDFANRFMIDQGQALLVIPQEHVPEFKRLLVAYYEDRDNGEIVEFMYSLCWRSF